MSRKLFALGMIMLLVLGLTTIGSLAQDTVTISYYTYTAAPDHLEDLDAIIAAFEMENPGIEIEVTTAAWGDYWTLLSADFAAGEQPDTFEINYENFVSYAADDLLLDLSDYLSEAPYYPRALEAFQYDGMQMALPEVFSTVLLFYNADLFDEAGIDYPAADWTWDEALQAGMDITALGDNIWGLHSSVHFWEFYKKAGQAGCEFFNEDMTESTLDSESCVGAVELMISFMDDDVMPDAVEMAGISDTDLFLTGDLGMLVVGTWMFDAFIDGADFTWDIQLEPGLENKGHHFFADGVAVDADTDNPAAAAAWAQFLTASETAATVRVDSSWGLPALDEPSYFESYLELSPPENREAVFAALESPINPPVIKRQGEMQDAINELLTAVVNGEMTAQEAMEEAKSRLDDLLE
jgi:multiple sugar transport system substrate-binding protein